MDKKLFADFIFKFLHGSAENLKLFYTSFLPDLVCGTFKFYEAIPFGARIIALLLEDEKSNERQLLLEHLEALYNNYDSLYLQSKRTVDVEQENNASNYDKAFNNGDLNCNEFNEIIAVLINIYRENGFYFELKTDKIIVKYPRIKISERYKEKELYLKEEKEKVFLTFNKIKRRIRKIKSIRQLLAAKGYSKATYISNAIKDVITKIQSNESCCWCNPVENTKHKCCFCNQLNKKYNELLKECPFLAEDLNQIIKRVQKTYNEATIEDLRKSIKDKIKSYIFEKCKKNQSAIPTSFINSLNYWYKNI